MSIKSLIKPIGNDLVMPLIRLRSSMDVYVRRHISKLNLLSNLCLPTIYLLGNTKCWKYKRSDIYMTAVASSKEKICKHFSYKWVTMLNVVKKLLSQFSKVTTWTGVASTSHLRFNFLSSSFILFIHFVSEMVKLSPLKFNQWDTKFVSKIPIKFLGTVNSILPYF